MKILHIWNFCIQDLNHETGNNLAMFVGNILQRILILIFKYGKLRANENLFQGVRNLTLNEAKTGMTVRIDSVGESKLKQRLMTMGLIPGTRVEILNSAPMGDPIALRLRSYNLAMRKDDAAQIQVSQVQ